MISLETPQQKWVSCRLEGRTSWVAQWKRICLQCRRCRRCGFDPRVRKIPWKRKWQPTPVCLSGKFHRQRSLAAYSPYRPWAHEESDTTELAHTHAHCLRREVQTPRRGIQCLLISVLPNFPASSLARSLQGPDNSACPLQPPSPPHLLSCLQAFA